MRKKIQNRIEEACIRGERERLASIQVVSPDNGRFTETIPQFFGPKQIAERLGISAQAVRVTFRTMPGVLLFGAGDRKTLRVPVDVLERWITQNSVKNR